MKGILLAGGKGTRLYPLTNIISKQLLPVYDKPMVYYPLAVLMEAGIKEILLISTPRDLPMYKELLGDGKKWGITLAYKEQQDPRGIAEAFILGEQFIGKERVALVLGDNIFAGKGLKKILEDGGARKEGATLLGYKVPNPEAFGVITFDGEGRAIAIEEKPNNPKSSYAVPGLYFYDHEVVEIAKNIQPSPRGELEITSVNNVYLKHQKLYVVRCDETVKWIDTGTHKALLEAGKYVATRATHYNEYIGALEAIAFNKGFIDLEQLEVLTKAFPDSMYKAYLLKCIKGCVY